MNELLQTLDESVFTPELTQKIQDLYESKIQEVTSEYATKLQEAEDRVQLVEEKATEYAEMVKETYEAKAEEYAEYVKEHFEIKVDEYTEYVKEELTKTVSEYLDRVVEEFVEENQVKIDEETQVAKANALVEGFEALLVTAGVSVSEIVEAKKAKPNEDEVASLKESVNKLVGENAKLKEQVNEMTKQSILNSFSADMNLAQKAKFEKLSEMAVFKGSVEDYSSKLKAIVETVMSSVVVEDNKPAQINENVVSGKLDTKKYF